MKLDLEEGTAEIDLEGAAELLQFAVNDPLMVCSKFCRTFGNFKKIKLILE